MAASGSVRAEAPASREEAAQVLSGCATDGVGVRLVGSGTKSGWGRPARGLGIELSTEGLSRIVEHNEGDLTAVLEAGVPLAEAQRTFAAAGQMLALDPPLGDAATIGGVVATADSGPLRHRYGAPRDLVVGMTVSLSDGTLAKAGGRVIKNVAGYDLAKLFTGAYGTLGLIVDVSVRLHPSPPTAATATATSDDPGLVARAASAISHAALETEALDVAWSHGEGRVLARYGGAAAGDQAASAVALLDGVGGLETRVVEDDEPLWTAQREGQRAPEGGLVVRISGRQTQLRDVLRLTAGLGGRVVGRAGMAISFMVLEGEDGELVEAVERLRAGLAPAPCVVLDGPATVRERIDPWGVREGPELELQRRVKRRFDPQNVCNPGIFVGGI